MPGLYIHIPFCKQPCSYCNFFFTTSKNLLERGMNAIKKEASTKSPDWQEPFQSLYLGGGTPSWIGRHEFESLIDTIRSHFHFSDQAEWTLEANPDDLNEENLKSWKEAGINRLSIGVQSFQDRFLHLMRRSHNSEQALHAIDRARDFGFDKFNIDLIYGIPGLDMKTWEAEIDKFLDLEINHLSAYALTVEPQTRLAQEIKKGLVNPPDDDLAAEQFLLLSQKLRANGFLHYEVSNYAKPGHEAKHNSSYWEGEPYLGIGPSAHSYRNNKRWWNKASMMPYIQAVETGISPSESEELNITTRFNEYLMTGLRTSKGISLSRVESEFGPKFASRLQAEIDEMKNPFLIKQEGVYFLQPEGFLLADRITSDLMIV